MSDEKYNHCYNYSQNSSNHHYYDNNPNNSSNGHQQPLIFSQRHENYYNSQGRNNNHDNNGGSSIVKRAAKRRVKHELPGPAGNWFRQRRRQNKSASASSTSTAMNEVDENEQQQQNHENNNNGNNNGNIVTKSKDNPDCSSSRSRSSSKPSLASTSTPPSPTSNTNCNKNNKCVNNSSKRDEQLFHDHSSDLHECNAWNLMCTTLQRIVPPVNLVLHNNISRQQQQQRQSDYTYTIYKSTMRRSIPQNYALIHEIHEGKYDTCHLTKELYPNDLRVPLIIGYVASVQCHAHSDWTVWLVDEMQSVAATATTAAGGGGGGIVCWIEERLVKQHSNWVRPGVVWMIEGARLALFSSLDDDEVHDDQNDTFHNIAAASATSTTTTTNAVVDVSPSTDNSRGGRSIDRMMLVGESSIVYAWTPEEASSTFTHAEFSDLMERRCDLGLHNESFFMDEDEKNDKEAVGKCNVDFITSSLTSSALKRKDDDDDDDILIKDYLYSIGSGGETRDVQAIEIIDVANEHDLKEGDEQVLEACFVTKEDNKHVESDDETKRISRVIDEERQESTQPSAKKNSQEEKETSQTSHDHTITKDVTEVEQLQDMASSVLLQFEETSLPAKANISESSPRQSTSIDIAQKSLPQLADGSVPHPQHDFDDSFDDMLDEDSLEEVVTRKNEGDHASIPIANTSTNGGDSFDDMLDENSFDRETPRKNEESIRGKLGSKMNTHGDDSFDDMLDEDSDDNNIMAIFQAKNPQPATASSNLFPSEGVSVLGKDDLADLLGEEDDEDF